MADKHSRPTRRETDSRLGSERRKTDQELANRVSSEEVEAAQVLRTARDRAEEVLRQARDRADEKLVRNGGWPFEQRGIEDERRREDQELQREYARADDLAQGRRRERAQLVASLLLDVRLETDRRLLLERADADEIVAKRDEFLGMVSHDLRNELAGVAMSVALLVRNAPEDDAGGKLLRAATNIQRINLRMSRLIGDLLDVVSIEAGKFTVVMEDDDVRRAVNESVESFQLIASAKEITLAAETTGEPIPARFDYQRILQVLGNLLTNALKFTSHAGRVTIRAEARPDEIRVSVADTGSGIAPERLESIFERFSQGSGRDRKGLGLGLFIATRIVGAHGGRIWAESSVGKGSTFHFTLPRQGG